VCIDVLYGDVLSSKRFVEETFSMCAGRFYYELDCNLLAYRTVTAAICQRSPLPLHELPTLANRLEAEL
jgi:hypothetical protein